MTGLLPLLASLTFVVATDGFNVVQTWFKHRFNMVHISLTCSGSSETMLNMVLT